MSKRMILSCLFFAFAIAMTVFIVFNGAQNGEESSQRSEDITEIIENVLEKVEIVYDHNTLSHNVRKAAHFTEYALLALFAGIACCFAFCENKLPALIIFVYSVCLALTDEFLLQYTACSRSPQITDVLIDSLGALTAIAIVYTAFRFISKKRIHV